MPATPPTAGSRWSPRAARLRSSGSRRCCARTRRRLAAPATSSPSSSSRAFRGTEPPGSSSADPLRLTRVSDVPEVPAELARLRSSIDNIDAALVHLLAERFKCTQQVGQLKAEQHLPAADPQREERQIARLRSLADSAGLDPVFAEAFLNFIIAEVIHHHERIANGDA